MLHIMSERISDACNDDFTHECWDDKDRRHLAILGKKILSQVSWGERTQQVVYSQDKKSRVIIFDWDAMQFSLQEHSSLWFVGFFGTKIDNVTEKTKAMLEDDDRTLTSTSLRGIPGLLGYASYEIPTGEWVNLVLVTDPSVIKAIYEQPEHKIIALDHSRSFYKNIRLHNGVTNGLLDTPASYTFTTTRYIQYPEVNAQPQYRLRRHGENLPKAA